MSKPYYKSRFSNAAAAALSNTVASQTVMVSLRLQTNDASMGTIRYEVISAPSSAISKEEHQVKPNGVFDMFSTQVDTRLARATVVRIIATPASSRYVLDHFEDASGNRYNTNTAALNLTLNQDTTVRAVFREANYAPTYYDVTVQTSPGSGGYVEGNPGIPKSGVVRVQLGGRITLTAHPAEGYKLDHWDGTYVAGKLSPKHELTITEQIFSDRTIRAVFAKSDVINVNYGPAVDVSSIGSVADALSGTSHQPDPQDETPPLTPSGNASATGGGASNGSHTYATDDATLTGKAKAFLKKWWWALAILAYIIYKERKGGKQ